MAAVYKLPDKGIAECSNVFHVYASFLTNGTSDATITYLTDGSTARGGGIATAVYSATGIYTVALNFPVQRVVCAFAQLSDADTEAGKWVTVSTLTNEASATGANLTFEIHQWSAGSGAAAPAATTSTGQRVNIHLVCKDSAVVP